MGKETWFGLTSLTLKFAESEGNNLNKKGNMAEKQLDDIGEKPPA